ncbi:hypothetical protein C1645_875354 [Glomus cerebriforme]|uniref:3D domain-containing protein n=1 Tax=Glomus cerebriforme TaxID=658196 RepID=A0A397T5J4_9GLOM|nr:hypothetical protein C1645_875354 [Glomus cerebriforme]
MNKKFAIILILFMIVTFVSSFPTTFEKRQTGNQISSNSKFTYYWVEFESDYKSTKTVNILTCDGVKITTVNLDFANAMKIEGTGVTKDGRVLNLGDCDCSSSSYDCFEELNKTKFPFGSTANDTPLVPFITVAANDIRKGTLLYIPKLDGIILPNSKVHNGCVKVDDKGFEFGKKHIDWFVAKKSNYDTLTKKNTFTSVSVFNGTSPNGQKCSLLNYT